MIEVVESDRSGTTFMLPDLEAGKRTVATILSRALESKCQDLPPAGARFILDLGIREDDQRRMLELLAKQQSGKLGAEEAEDLAAYVEADNVLSILRARAILALKKAGQEP